MISIAKEIAIYVRVSSSVQEDGTSLETQTAECTRLALSLGYSVDDGCVYREVGSGASLDRAQLGQIRSLAAAGALRALFVFNTDRLARDPVDLLVLVREFNGYGVVVHFVHDPSDDSPEGELVRFVLGYSGHRERAMIRERTMRGKEAVARGGRMPVRGPNGVYGYDYDPVTKARTVNKTESKVVKMIFRYYLGGRSMYWIANTLNAQGIPSKTGGSWSVTTIRGILSNESYIGVDYYGKTRSSVVEGGKVRKVDAPRTEWIEIRGYSPRLIADAVFHKAQGRLASTQARYGSRNVHRYLVTGFAECGFCGRPISGGGPSGKYRYYRCNGRHDTKGKSAGELYCQAKPINGDWLDDQVWSHVSAMVQDPSGVIADLELNFRMGGGDLGKEIEQLRKQVRKTEQEELRLLGLYRRGTIRVELLDAQMQGLSASLDDLRGRLESLEEQRKVEENVLAAGERIRDYCRNVSAGLDALDYDGKRMLMSSLGVKVLAVKGDAMITAEIDPGFVVNSGLSA